MVRQSEYHLVELNFSFQRPEHHQLKTQEFDRQGYLFHIERSKTTHSKIIPPISFISDKIIGTTAMSKHYCQYRKDQNLLRMINFTQTSTKQVLDCLFEFVNGF